MRTRKLQAFLTAGILTLALASCGNDDNGGTTTTKGEDLGLIKQGELKVCSDAPYKPFDIIQGSTFTGFDGDLVTEIAKGLDLKLVPLDSAFDPLQSGLALNSNQCDMAASAMTITPERQQKLTFSDGYYDSKQSLLVPSGSDIKSIDDLSGKKVAVQQGTTGKAYAQDNAPDDADILSFPDDSTMFTALKGGSVDAILQDLPVNLVHTKEGQYDIVEQYDTNEEYGFAFKKTGKEALVAAVNDQLAKLHDSGKYDDIYNKYFAVD